MVGLKTIALHKYSSLLASIRSTFHLFVFIPALFAIIFSAFHVT